MKKVFSFAFTAIMLCLPTALLFSCSDKEVDDYDGGGNSNNATVTFKRVDIAGAKALALASDGTAATASVPATRAEETTVEVSNPLYKVNDDGTLVEVNYTITVETRISGRDKKKNEVFVEQLEANMRLKMDYIYTVDDKWLLLCNCAYDYPDFEELDDPYRTVVRHLLWDNQGIFYLVRRSDGALFELPRYEKSDGWLSYYAYPWMSTDFHQPSDLYGNFESLNGEIYYLGGYSGHYYGSIMRLQDAGDKLNIQRMLGDDIVARSILPTSDGYIGTNLYFGDDINSIYPHPQPAVLYPATPTVDIIKTAEGKDLGDGTHLLFCIGGELYLLRDKQFRRVNITESSAREDYEVLAELGKSESAEIYPLIYKGISMSWISPTYGWVNGDWKPTSNTLITFTPRAALASRRLVRRALPDHYPPSMSYYYDGVGYVMDDSQNSFWVCDLSKDKAESVTLDWSEMGEYQSLLVNRGETFGTFNPSSRCFSSQRYLTDGRKVMLYVDVDGDSRGKVRVIVSGDKTAGRVINVLVRLN